MACKLNAAGDSSHCIRVTQAIQYTTTYRLTDLPIEITMNIISHLVADETPSSNFRCDFKDLYIGRRVPFTKKASASTSRKLPKSGLMYTCNRFYQEMMRALFEAGRLSIHVRFVDKPDYPLNWTMVEGHTARIESNFNFEAIKVGHASWDIEALLPRRMLPADFDAVRTLHVEFPYLILACPDRHDSNGYRNRICQHLNAPERLIRFLEAVKALEATFRRVQILNLHIHDEWDDCENALSGEGTCASRDLRWMAGYGPVQFSAEQVDVVEFSSLVSIDDEPYRPRLDKIAALICNKTGAQASWRQCVTLSQRSLEWY